MEENKFYKNAELSKESEEDFKRMLKIALVLKTFQDN
jgi:hypothetical protein